MRICKKCMAMGSCWGMIVVGGTATGTEGTSCLCRQAAEAARLVQTDSDWQVIRPFEGYGPERHRGHKTGQIAHHRPPLRS